MEQKINIQHNKGKLYVLERLELLLDHQSFHSILESENKDTQGTNDYDGVMAGYGTIHGKKVYVYAQDFTYIAGTLGTINGKQIVRTIREAINERCPIIGIHDSGGARIQEGIDALAAYGDIFYYNTLASGYIPQISIQVGPCAGGAVYSPGLTDFIFTVDKISNMFVTGPKVVKTITNQDVSAEELGGTKVHASMSGASHFRCETEKTCFKQVRKLIELLPEYEEKKSSRKSRTFHGLSFWPGKKQYDQRCLLGMVPTKVNQPYDMHKVIDILVDRDSFLEVQSEFAQNVIAGLAKLDDITVGIVANQPMVQAGVLDCDASDKAARFVRYCDAFQIPIVTLVDVPGFLPGFEQEKKGIIRHGAKLLYAYAEATTVKLTVILRKAYGGSYIAMGSKHLKADRVYAWPTGEVAVMGAESAIELLYRKQMETMSVTEKQVFMQEKADWYQKNCMSLENAVEKGYIDQIIQPVETRKQLIQDIATIAPKEEDQMIYKKHGNIPL